MLKLSFGLLQGYWSPCWTRGFSAGQAQPAGTHIAHGGRIQVLVSTLLVPVCTWPADQWDQATCEPDYDQCRQSEVWRWSVILILQMSP